MSPRSNDMEINDQELMCDIMNNACNDVCSIYPTPIETIESIESIETIVNEKEMKDEKSDNNDKEPQVEDGCWYLHGSAKNFKISIQGYSKKEWDVCFVD